MRCSKTALALLRSVVIEMTHKPCRFRLLGNKKGPLARPFFKQACPLSGHQAPLEELPPLLLELELLELVEFTSVPPGQNS
jgi:hypothetical protein